MCPCSSSVLGTGDDAASEMTVESESGTSLRPSGMLRDMDGLRVLAKVGHLWRLCGCVGRSHSLQSCLSGYREEWADSLLPRAGKHPQRCEVFPFQGCCLLLTEL